MSNALSRVSASGWLGLLLGLSSGQGFALAITDATVGLSGLTISSSSGSVSESDLMTCGSVTGVFNSLGESAGNSNPSPCAAFFNMGTTDVTASAAVTYAQGSSQAFASLSGGVSASSSVDIPGNTGDTVQAGVTLEGSVTDLVGNFAISGAGTNPVTVNFSANETGSLFGVSDIYGYLQTDDVTASLTIYGTPDGSDTVLFDYETLPLLPSIPGVPDYPATTVPISQTLSSSSLGASLSLDPTQTYQFDLEVNAESQAFSIPEPGSLALVLAALGGLAGGGAAARGRRIRQAI